MAHIKMAEKECHSPHQDLLIVSGGEGGRRCRQGWRDTDSRGQLTVKRRAVLPEPDAIPRALLVLTQ